MSAITRGIKRSEHALKPPKRLPYQSVNDAQRPYMPSGSKNQSNDRIAKGRPSYQRDRVPAANKFDFGEQSSKSHIKRATHIVRDQARALGYGTDIQEPRRLASKHDFKKGFGFGQGYERIDKDRNTGQNSPITNPQLRLGSHELQELEQRSAPTKKHVSIVRSTAASEFIYGRSSVLAALKAGRRQFYNLYSYESSGDAKEDNTEEIFKYALNNDTKITWIHGTDGLAGMDRLVKGRPHNGVILEASPLPKLPVSALEEAVKGTSFNVRLRRQNRDEEVINGSNPEIALNSSFRRYPFVVMLDEIVDQGNLGGILRSAYFLGADAVVLSTHMALMNAVTLKAASGAAEDIKILSVHNTTGFLETSSENGWKIYAAVAPPSSSSNYKSRHVELNDLGCPLQKSACILLLGDKTISIPGQRSHHSGVDSLNVSVAAGILINGFLKDPVYQESRAPKAVIEDPDTLNVLF